ncbi:MAG TPA: helix-turn-helix domain-containing protein, partial [Dehalococcoidia bacterium]|nr:helix-turn-helix domain-containing protein [Dehalococcoidia bacterium]
MAELTISEAAVALGVSVDTIRRKIKRGELRARQDNKGRYLVAVEAPPRGAAPAVAGLPENAAETARLRLDLE